MTTTRARLGVVDRDSEIADAVPDQRNREVREVSDHDLTDLTGEGRAIVDDELDEVRLVDDVMVGRTTALVRDTGELPGAVLVEDLRLEPGLDELANIVGQ